MAARPHYLIELKRYQSNPLLLAASRIAEVEKGGHCNDLLATLRIRQHGNLTCFPIPLDTTRLPVNEPLLQSLTIDDFI